MFEKATRGKLRFDSKVGQLSVEDLWDLPLLSIRGGVNLDDIAKGLSRELRESAEESFVVKNNAKNVGLELKFNIVKHIIDVKLEEIDKANNEAIAKVKKDKILRVIADKEDNVLNEKGIDELREMLNEL